MIGKHTQGLPGRAPGAGGVQDTTAGKEKLARQVSWKNFLLLVMLASSPEVKTRMFTAASSYKQHVIGNFMWKIYFSSLMEEVNLGEARSPVDSCHAIKKPRRSSPKY